MSATIAGIDVSLARMTEDRALVDAVLAHTPGAFERLVHQHQGLCWHIIQRLVRNPEDVRELCQEAFLRVHRNLHQYRFDAALKSWIAQVAYSVARRHLERKQIPLAEPAGEGDNAPIDLVGDEFDLESAVADAQTAHCLHVAIESLPPLQRTLLTLYHLDELPLAEIATITGLAQGTIKSHLFRSRKQLHVILAPRIGVAA